MCFKAQASDSLLFYWLFHVINATKRFIQTAKQLWLKITRQYFLPLLLIANHSTERTTFENIEGVYEKMLFNLIRLLSISADFSRVAACSMTEPSFTVSSTLFTIFGSSRIVLFSLKRLTFRYEPLSFSLIHTQRMEVVQFGLQDPVGLIILGNHQLLYQSRFAYCGYSYPAETECFCLVSK